MKSTLFLTVLFVGFCASLSVSSTVNAAVDENCNVPDSQKTVFTMSCEVSDRSFDPAGKMSASANPLKLDLAFCSSLVDVDYAETDTMKKEILTKSGKSVSLSGFSLRKKKSGVREVELIVSGLNSSDDMWNLNASARATQVIKYGKSFKMMIDAYISKTENGSGDHSQEVITVICKMK